MSSQSRDLASRMADAAVALIESLDVPQRATMCRPFDDTEERLRFFYTPTDHGSLPISAMRAGQVVTVSSSTRARTIWPASPGAQTFTVQRPLFASKLASFVSFWPS